MEPAYHAVPLTTRVMRTTGCDRSKGGQWDSVGSLARSWLCGDASPAADVPLFWHGFGGELPLLANGVLHHAAFAALGERAAKCCARFAAYLLLSGQEQQKLRGFCCS